MKKIMLLIIGLLFLLPVSALEPSNYDIFGDKIDVSMVVEENGQVHVTTVLDVTFNTYHHGIDVELPQRYDMTINGVARRYFFPITNIQVEDFNYRINENRNGVVVRIGSESEQVIGPVRYTYSYTINMRDLGLDGMQMFYMNIVGNQWRFPINQTAFKIQMPNEFGEKIFFYPPVGGGDVVYERDGTLITGAYNYPLVGEALTVEIPLPDGFFTFPNTDYRVFALLGSVVIAALIGFVFVRFGRDPIVTETVEFTAPEGLSSAEVGYVYRGMSLPKDVISLIIYWASQGFLIIEELTEDNIKLSKIKDLPSDRPSEERRVFLALFKDREEVTTKELTDKFAATVTHATSAIPKRFTSDPELHVFNRKASFMKVLMIFIAPLIPALYFGSTAYANSGNQTDLGLFFMIAFGIFVIVTVGGSFLVAYDRVHKTSQRLLNALILVLIVVGVSLVLSLFAPLSISPLLGVMNVLYLIAIFSAANTGKRTELGSRWLGQILGLRRFIEVAEHDRLVALVEETPEIFYDILPYAYVLGVTDIWSKKFESIAIPQPDWYVSSNPNFTTFVLWSSLNRSMNTVSTSMLSMPTPKGSSGGGGSFGGGGGGGFSGGGFGGGGGGGW